MSLALFIAWFSVTFPLVYSPGPANTLFASNGARFGVKRSLPFLMGVNIAFIPQCLLMGAGFHQLLLTFPQFFTALQYVGIAYLLYLSWKFWTADVKKSGQDANCLSFRDGALLTYLNPKVWMTLGMMFTQFLQPGDGLEKVALLTALTSSLNISAHITWVIFGPVLLAKATRYISVQNQNKCFALMILGSIYFLL